LSTKTSETEMSSDVTRHTATALPVPGEPALHDGTDQPGPVVPAVIAAVVTLADNLQGPGTGSRTRMPRTDRGASPAASAATSVTVHPQVSTAVTVAPQPAATHVAGASCEPSALALLETMDGAERALLLHHLAQAHPDIIEAGVAWLAARRAECEKRRRVAHNRKATLRHRAKRAAARNQA
jgi:hypothetical protein